MPMCTVSDSISREEANWQALSSLAEIGTPHHTNFVFAVNVREGVVKEPSQTSLPEVKHAPEVCK